MDSTRSLPSRRRNAGTNGVRVEENHPPVEFFAVRLANRGSVTRYHLLTRTMINLSDENIHQNQPTAKYLRILLGNPALAARAACHAPCRSRAGRGDF